MSTEEQKRYMHTRARVRDGLIQSSGKIICPVFTIHQSSKSSLLMGYKIKFLNQVIGKTILDSRKSNVRNQDCDRC